MAALLMSSKGQVVIPAAVRRKLGLGPGARLELVEEPDGIRLRVARAVPARSVAELAGMVRAPARGKPRSLEDFDPASLLRRQAPAR